MSDRGHYRDSPRRAARRIDDPDEYEPEEYEPEYSPRQRPQRSLGARVGRGAFFISIGGILTAGLVFVLAGEISDRLNISAQGPGAPTAPSPAAAPETAFGAAPPPTALIDNQIALQAQQWGITKCLPRIVDLATFLTADTDATWRLSRGMTNPDQEMFAGSIIMRNRTNGVQAFSTFFVSPVDAGACDAGYDVVVYVPQTCEQTRAIKPPGFDTRINLGPLAEFYSNADGRSSVTLIPAGPAGCIMVRTGFAY